MPKHPAETSHDLQALREEVERLRRFNRDVAHEMLGAVASMTHLAALGELALHRGDPARLETMLRLMREEAAAATGLVDGLVALGEHALPPASCEVVSLAGCVAKAQRNLILDRRHEATANMPVHVGHLPRVWGHETLLVQLFTNLIGNALKFTQRNPSGRVEVFAEGYGDQIAVCVRDNGIGFDARQADRLFEPFHRGHGASYPGHGLGLSVVRSITERHGGRVWAESEPGQGARFYVCLPICSDMGLAGGPPPAPRRAADESEDEADREELDDVRLGDWAQAFVASPDQVRDAVRRVGTDLQAMGRYLLGLRPSTPQ
ncbi:ATP-binding protein [Ideonella sp. YS5]|uniref:ATP-binding protein n=1 Tax=Ideonella sp. YS5 TaxID=3453714 RepID=UPI003EE86894